VLIVIAAVWPTTNALPAGSFASLDGDLKYFNGEVSVSYPYVSAGTHLVRVSSSDTNYVPVEDDNYPNQVDNPWNAAFGNPRYVQANRVKIGEIAGSVGYSFIGRIRADGEVRDADTHARIGGAGITFLAANGFLTKFEMNGDPFYANYKTPWQSQGDGLFPGNVWLPAQTLHVKVTASGYQDLNQNNVIVDPAAGATPNLGTKYLAPIDNDADGIRDSWETQYFGGNISPSADADGDGQSNWEEYKVGTGPTNPNDALDQKGLKEADGMLTIRWLVAEGRQYRVTSSGTVTGTWEVVGGPWEAGWGQTQMQWEASTGTDTQRLYRVEALVP
ncbi:MAG: hypothetical protein V1929_05810, partial [bacterium]